jgi:hypothetical protein
MRPTLHALLIPRLFRGPSACRAALESPHVTQHLHKWVDLIFGYKQQGQAAVTSHNVFYYLTYYGAIDLTQIKDESLRRATELQIAHFGQCPMQLFVRPHPQQLRRTSVPRPVGLSLASIDSWIEVSSRSMTTHVPAPLFHELTDRPCLRRRDLGSCGARHGE